MREGTCTATAKRTGKRCRQWACNGMRVCRMHGGGTPQAKRKARERIECANAAKLAARLGTEVEPMSDPATALARVVGQAQAVYDVLWARLGEEPDDEAVLAAYTRAVDQLARFLSDMTKLGLVDRLARVEEAKAAALAAVIQAVLRDLHLSVEQHASAPGIVRRHLLALDADVTRNGFKPADA